MNRQHLKSTLLKDFVAYSLIVVAIVFFILTIRPGHNWGGDFALYISHAINLSNGHSYQDTGFIYNPKDPFISPRSYPPVYPLLLAPVYKLFGLNLYAMKVAGIAIFGIFLLFFYRYIGNRLESPLFQILAVASMAFSPWFWEAKDRILPDFVFILLLYTFILLFDRMTTGRRSVLFRYLLALGGGIMVCLLYATRSLGMLLIPALYLNDIVRRRLISRETLIATIMFAVFYFAQNMILQTDQSYFESLKAVDSEEPVIIDNAVREDFHNKGFLDVITTNIEVLGERIPRKLHYYGSMLSAYWYIGDSLIPGVVLLTVMTILAISGFLMLIIKSPSVGDYFVLTYVIILLLVPFQQPRYLLPVIPLYLLYIFRATEQLKQLAGSHAAGFYSRLGNAIPVIVAVTIAVSYVSSYALSTSDDILRGVESSDSREMFEFIREKTPIDSLLVFHKPRPLSLFTGRKSLKYHEEPDLEILWRDLVDMGATHIVLPKYIDPALHAEYFFPGIVVQYSGNLEVIFENESYAVYRIVQE